MKRGDPSRWRPLRDAIRETRTRAGLTQEQAAERLGIADPQTISHWERKAVHLPDPDMWASLRDLGLDDVSVLRRLGYLDDEP